MVQNDFLSKINSGPKKINMCGAQHISICCTYLPVNQIWSNSIQYFQVINVCYERTDERTNGLTEGETWWFVELLPAAKNKSPTMYFAQ